jgi:hypothetical protein
MENNDLINLVRNTIKWIDDLSVPPSNYPSNWTELKEVQLAHIYLLDKLLEQNFTIPQYKNERGIVIGAGGAKYFGCAFACANILRNVGCKLPIEFWYLDEYEMDNSMKQICDKFDINYVNAAQYCKNNNLSPRILNGWELKPFATLHSSFKEVLYLDADNIPVKDPTYLFEYKQYKDLGAIFWPDLPPNRRKEWLPAICWNNVGLEYRDEPDFETGQYLINKEKCFVPLNMTMWMNEHSDWFYKFVFGDKSTFHLAWRKCNFDYCIPAKPAGWRRPAILQYDLNNDLIFQHACQGKELIFSGKGPTNQINHHLITQAYEERSKYWSGSIYSWVEMNTEEKQIAQTLIGKYNYIRVNLGNRILELKDEGIIGEGQASCERRWSVRVIDNIPTIICIGAAHKGSEIAMFFAKDDGSGKIFNGKWTSFEKCDIILERLNNGH